MVTLSGLETALLNVGRAVVTPLFTRWLGGRRQERERELPLAELLRQRASDEFARRRGERQIEAVVDEVGARLKPLVKTRFAALPENEVASCVQAVADTFNGSDLTDEALFAVDLDPARLVTHLRSCEPPAGLSELGQRLYDVAIEDCARCFTQFVVQTVPFTGRAQVEILARLSEITDVMSQTLQRLALVAPESGSDFRVRYLEFLARKLNVLELVGLDTQFRPRTELSVAYISLAVSEGEATPARLPQWEPGMLRHARLEGAGSERVEQALARRTRTLIRGEAGAGKSTLLRWLAVTAATAGFPGALADWNGRIPFLIKLRSWSGTLPAPEQFLTGVADPVAGAMPGPWVTEQLRAGRALLLVDGVDELPAERRPHVRAWLRDLLAAYPDMLVVVTSRPPAAPVRWLETEGFDALTLERLAPADVRALIGQWHQAAAASPSLPCPAADLSRYEQSLLTQLSASRHLYRLAGNPLMAAMLCALNLDRQTHLPPDRMGIYQAAVDMLLQRRDTERSVHSTLPEMTARERLQLLQDLAWRISLNSRSELTRAEAELYLARRLAGMPRVNATPAAVLTHLLERSGILRSPAADRIDFVHRTFQEYLAARESAEQNMGGLLASQAHRDTWREIVVMAAGHGNSPMRTELIEEILRRADDEPRQRRTLTLLAAACLETVPSLEPPELLAEIERRFADLLPPRNRLEARSLYPLGELLLRHLDHDPRPLTEAQAAASVVAAALVNGPNAMSFLARYTHDPRGDVQRELVDAWRHFEPHAYAKRVLADAPLNAGRATISEPGLMEAVHHLRHLSVLDARFDSFCDLDTLPPAPSLRTLFLLRSWRGRLDSLQRYAALDNLMFSTPHRDLTAAELRGLRHLDRLRTLTLYGGEGIDADGVQAVAEMTRLQHLNIGLGDMTDLCELAALTELTSLYLENGPVETLDGLAVCPIVNLGLGLQGRYPRVMDDDWGAAFPHVRSLNLWGQDVLDLGFVGSMPTVERLWTTRTRPETLASLVCPGSLTHLVLLGGHEPLDLRPVLRHRRLETVELSSPYEIDLAPFGSWDGGVLHLKVPRRQPVKGREALPASVRLSRNSAIED